MLHRGGPELPYQIIAGVVPCNSGWLTASCKIAGVTISIEEPMVFATFAEILDYKPAFSVIGVHAPIGFLDEATPKGRECDQLARGMLGPRRGASIRSAPSRAVLRGEVDSGVDAVTGILLHHYREISDEIAPYRQRTVYSVEPELTFYELNHDKPLTYSKRSEYGRDERKALLAARLDQVDNILVRRPPEGERVSAHRRRGLYVERAANFRKDRAQDPGEPRMGLRRPSHGDHLLGPRV